MKKPLTPTEIRKRITPVLKSHGIKRAALFGSAARGEMRRGSDVDLLVDTNGKLDLFEFVGLKHRLENRLDRKVDLVEYDAIKPALRSYILQDQVSMV